MFVEYSLGDGSQNGFIEVIAGSMFSGKTEELIRRLKRAMIAQQKVRIFKPEKENRYSPVKVVSHDNNELISMPVNNSNDILPEAQGADVIGIDEAQFFDDHLPEVVNELASKGIRFVIAGLDMDYTGKPMGPMPDIMAIADDVTKVHAVCIRCGNLAQFSHRKANTTDLFLLGERDVYEPLCRNCFSKLSSH